MTLKILWFALGFMTMALVSPRRTGPALEGESFLDKGVRFFGKAWFENPGSASVQSDGRRLTRNQGTEGGRVWRRGWDKGKAKVSLYELGTRVGRPYAHFHLRLSRRLSRTASLPKCLRRSWRRGIEKNTKLCLTDTTPGYSTAMVSSGMVIGPSKVQRGS